MSQLCRKPANLEHIYILSSYQVALAQGWYKWRHDQVLKALAHTLERPIQYKTRATTSHQIRQK
jgi:hypothetical protein